MSTRNSRREFLVRVAGVTLGTFYLPTLNLANETAAATSSELPVLDLLIPPRCGRFASGQPYVLYIDGDGTTMIWHADNEEEFAEIKRFYDASRNPGCPQVAESEVFPIERSREELRLLDAIVNSEEDDRPRLAYADFLDRRGDPRGEFIRADVMTEKLPEDDKRFEAYNERYWELLRDYGEEWYRPLAALGLWPTMGCEFAPHYWMSRGLVNTAEINIPGILPQKTVQLFQAAPALTALTIQVDDLDVAAIVARSELRQIRSLQFDKSIDLQFAADGPNRSVFGNDGMRALVNSKNLVSLRTLDVSGSDLDDQGFEVLVTSPLWKQLTDLDVGNCHLTSEVVDIVTEAPPATYLKNLLLEGNDIGGACCRLLTATEQFPALERLDLSSIPLDTEALSDLQGAILPRLRVLLLSSCQLQESGVRSLVDWLLDSRLTSFDLSSNELPASAVAPLWDSKGLKRLLELDLGCNPIGDEGAAGVARMHCRLESLTLTDCGLTAAGLQQLAAAPNLSALKTLDVGANPIGTAGATALAKSPHLRRLESLTVGCEAAGDNGRASLVERFGEDVVTFIDDSETQDE